MLFCQLYLILYHFNNLKKKHYANKKNSLISFGFVFTREFSLSGATVGYI